jgi:hypothetical protein
MRPSNIRFPQQDQFPYVSVYDEALPVSFCDRLIAKFEANEDNEQVETTLAGVRHFKEVNISQHWHNEHESFVNVVQGVWKTYVAEHRILFDIQFPRQFGYEQFRMKRYLPNGKDEFAQHTDVGSYATSRRFTAFLWYLNTPTEGGATEFGRISGAPILTIPAIAGRLLVFPPLWTHPHWGCKVTGGPKYIVSGYLHYI